MLHFTIKTAKTGSLPVQDFEYGWYELGNLEFRKKWLNSVNNNSLTEKFTYDGLDRLITISLNGTNTGYHSYDAAMLGNMTYKYNDGNTIFSNAIYGTNGFGAHAITEVKTANPVLSGPRQDINYNGFDKVFSITEGSHDLHIQYGHHRQRISQQYSNGTTTIDKVWAGSCEFITKNGQLYKHTYLSGPMGVFAVHIISPDGKEEINYIHKDQLGSWNTITDEDGSLLQELSFDAWGNRRDPATWRAFTSTPSEPVFDRGFTGHEHLYALNLINMNGRVYDPIVGRMLSPDNYMQAPGLTQSFNRYSYCLNNPLKYTDPDGNWAGWDDLIVGGIGFAYGYVSSGITTGDWGWKSIGAGAIGAGTALLGYYSGGASSTSSIANIFAGAPSFGNGYAANIALNYSGRMVATNAIASILPSASFSIGDATLSIGPSFMLGSGGYSLGLNIQGSYNIGDWTIGGAIGSSYGKSGFTGITGFETRQSGFLGYDDGGFGIGVSSTKFGSGETSQTLGRATMRYKEFSGSYENDGTPFDFIGLGDGGDDYRTASVTLGYKDFTIGMLLFTGYRDFDAVDKSNPREYPYGMVSNPEINKYNAGILYAGYGNMRAGWNQDNIRHAFQNVFAHGVIKKQAWIPRKSWPNQPYLVHGTNNPYTNW